MIKWCLPAAAPAALRQPISQRSSAPVPLFQPQASGLTDDVLAFNGTVLAPTNAAFVEHIKELNVDINNLNDTTKKMVIAVLVRPSVCGSLTFWGLRHMFICG